MRDKAGSDRLQGKITAWPTKATKTKHNKTYTQQGEHTCHEFGKYVVGFVYLKLIPATNAELPIWYGEC